MTRSIPVVSLALCLLCFAAPGWAGRAEDEVRLGRDVMAEVRGLGLTADETLDLIGGRLAGVMKRTDLPWRFWVIEDVASYNAFAAPGGFVFITRPYYEKLNDDEAAFVVAHEMAHIDLGHHERHLRRVREANLGNLIIDILTNGSGAWRAAVDVGSTAYVTHYSRELERDADFAGYEYAKAAGYDARAAVTALNKLAKEPNVHPWIVNVYSTHPLLSSREDRLAALGGEEPEDVPAPEASPSHRRDLTGGSAPLDPAVPIAVRILAPEGGRWESRWRKNFTKHLHRRLLPLGFEIAGDDLMYKPEIGDPVDAARSRNGEYLVLVTVLEMKSEETGPADLAGTPVRARIRTSARLVRVEDRALLWEGDFSDEQEGRDVLPVDPEFLYTDTCLGALAEKAAGYTAAGCATAVRAAVEARPPEDVEAELVAAPGT